jgi:protein ImuA
MHECISNTAEQAAATQGFLAALLGKLLLQGGACIWIGTARTLYPPALAAFGVPAERLIFIDLQKEKDILWAMEEALKCEGLCCVIVEVNEISFIESRRLQLATEQTRVTGFLIRRNPKNLSTTCVTRWKVQPIESNKGGDLPGLGFPRWNVSLLKVRNGKPGSWQMEWRKKRFQLIQKPAVIEKIEERKVV